MTEVLSVLVRSQVAVRPGRRRLYPNTVELRTYLHELMAKHGLRTSRAVAERHGPGLRFQAVDAVIAGRVEAIRIVTLERLADALSCNVDDLIKRTQVDEPWLMPSIFDPVPKDLRESIERTLAQMLRAAGVIE